MSFNQQAYIKTLTDPTIQGREKSARAQCDALVHALEDHDQSAKYLTEDSLRRILGEEVIPDLRLLKFMCGSLWAVIMIAVCVPALTGLIKLF